MTKLLRTLAALLALALLAAACSDDDADDTATEDTAAESMTTSEGAIDEADDSGSESADDAAVDPEAAITILAVAFDSATVTLRNDGDEAVDFTGYRTCNRPLYDDMPTETLEPGATLDVDVTTLDLRASAGEFGLYRTGSFDDPADMVAYVQWGKADNGRAATAVEAGLIEEGEFVDNGGENIVRE